jgi:hypothetical protein
MSGFDDDELRAMLVARADRAAVDSAPVVAEARARALVAPRRGTVRRRLRPVRAALGGVATLAAVILALAVPLALRPAASPAPSAGLSQASRSSGASLASPGTSTTPRAEGDRHPGGIPRVIDGEPVLVGLDAQARWRDATEATPFLVGGWFDSRVLNTCSGGIGPPDPNPLAARGCPRFQVAGMPGRPFYPETLAMPQGDRPIVLRVHTRDPGAETCIPEYVASCRERVVVDDVVWFGDATTVAEPIGPQEARRRATSVFVMEWRDQPDNSLMAVDEDIFTVPIACPAPWPTLLFSIDGDPRYGLIAVFPDSGTRERFEAETDPSSGTSCLGIEIGRPAGPRWVGYQNMLVLTFGDDAFAARLSKVLADPQRKQAALDLVEPELDRSLETLNDYVVARAMGELDHAWGERLIPDLREFEAPGGDVVVDAYAEWTADVFRRHAANALIGDIGAVDDRLTDARVGPRAWKIVQDPGVTRSMIYRVTYRGATDPALATEEFLAFQVPESTFRDWQLVRIAGEPYPVLPIQVAEPQRSSGGDTSTDVMCLPAGEPCGPRSGSPSRRAEATR